MANKKHDWPQVWKSIASITLFSVLSVALFGLLYWGLNMSAWQPSSLRWVVGVVWVIATMILLRKSILLVQDDFPRSVLNFALVVALASGLLGIGDYVHRRVSSFYDCDSIVKDSLGDSEFIQSKQVVDVDTGMVGYYIYPMEHPKRGGTANISFEAYVAAPIKQSKGVYTVYHVRGKEHDYSFASDEKLHDYYHEFCVALRDTMRKHHYDTRCTTFQRIHSTDEYYDYIIKAVENASILCNDTAYYVENHPVMIRPVYHMALNNEAHVKVGFVICFAVCMGISALVLVLARTKKKKRKGMATDNKDPIEEMVQYVRNPRNWPNVFIFMLPIIYYIVALALGYKASSSVLDYGGISGYNLFVKDEWWRLVTGMLMHANLIHLICNLLMLYAILLFFSAIFPLYQGWLGALVFLGTGLVSSFCCALFSNGVTVGSSGAIMGMLGFAFGSLMFDFKNLWTPHNKLPLIALAILIGPTMLLSFTRGISLAGHLSGLLCGLIAGMIYHKLHDKE